MAEYLIDNYAIRQWSSRSTKRASSSVAVAGIYLYNGDTRRGHIYFYADETDLRPPIHRKEEQQILLNFNLSQFEATLAMLASGAPISLFYNSSTDAGLAANRQVSAASRLGGGVSTGGN